MQGIRKLAVSGSFLLTASLALMAQAPAPVPTVTPPPQPMFQQRGTGPGPTLGTVLGVPLVVDTPVGAPYCNSCAYSNFAGQPMRSAGAVGAEANTAIGSTP